jgi:hypothetical protein
MGELDQRIIAESLTDAGYSPKIGQRPPTRRPTLQLLFPCSLVPLFLRSLVPLFPRSLVPSFLRSLVPLFPRSLVLSFSASPPFADNFPFRAHTVLMHDPYPNRRIHESRSTNHDFRH